MDTFVVKTLQGALSLDALASSHPMSATVYSPDEIQGIFDRISYDKGEWCRCSRVTYINFVQEEKNNLN